MAYTVFTDGAYGTTGLGITTRLAARGDLKILEIEPEKRKDLSRREKLLNEADIVFLCLPDDEAKTAVSLVKNPETRVIDASCAHRVSPGWAYGLPELGRERRERIRASKRVSVPGCFATGFILLMFPLVRHGFIPADYPASCFGVSGYSGRGAKFINEFESGGGALLKAPCFYATEQNHKHLPEMREYSGLAFPPVFSPVIAGYYKGLTVVCPLVSRLMPKKAEPAALLEFYANFYEKERFINVTPPDGVLAPETGFFSAAPGLNAGAGAEITVFGNSERVTTAARLDNLGKGSSAAAMQNLNIMLGLPEATGF